MPEGSNRECYVEMFMWRQPPSAVSRTKLNSSLFDVRSVSANYGDWAVLLFA